MVATRVGSVAESVTDGVTGHLVVPGDVEALAGHWSRLFSERQAARQMGVAGRQVVADRWSLDAMVGGYQDLIRGIYTRKVAVSRTNSGIYADRLIATKAIRGGR